MTGSDCQFVGSHVLMTSALPMLVGIFLAFCTAPTYAVCGFNLVWRNNNATCPQLAVCADKFDTYRDWYNGTTCDETRVTHNCMCPGQTVCPYNDPNHRLYSSATKMQYVCTPVCQLPYCGQNQVAQSFYERAYSFGRNNYYKITCRCPRHHVPVTGGRTQHAVEESSSPGNGFATKEFVCKLSGNEGTMTDPCVG